MSDGVRRIVTGHDAQGRSIVVSDSAAGNVKRSPNRPWVTIHNLWMTDSAPARIADDEDMGGQIAGLEPPASGTVFRVVEFGPETEHLAGMDADKAAAAFEELGAGHAAQGGAAAPHPFMHRTETVDYALVLSGEIYLVLDDSEVLLRAGDVCVQRGTNHAWSNRSDEPCRIAFILVDGEKA